jgi:octopine/nopaline transport system substrate-binding protein
MKFRIVFAAAAIAALAAGVLPVSAQDKTDVTIALEGAYAPWNLTNPDGSLGGFEPELAVDLCARAKLNCKLVPRDWDTIIESLNANKFDVIMDALSITPERQKVIDFSIPYAATPAAFATTKDSPLANMPGAGTRVKLDGVAADDKAEIDKLREVLKGHSIGVQTATNFSAWLEANFKDVADIREYKTTAERDLDLVAGRIDIGFDDETAFQAAFDTSGNEDLAFTGPVIAGKVWGDGMALGLRKSDTALRDKFNTAIEAALADGTVKKLSLKWFKLDVSP